MCRYRKSIDLASVHRAPSLRLTQILKEVQAKGRSWAFDAWMNSGKDWGQVRGVLKYQRVKEIRSKLKYGFRSLEQLQAMLNSNEKARRQNVV